MVDGRVLPLTRVETELGSRLGPRWRHIQSKSSFSWSVLLSACVLWFPATPPSSLPLSGPVVSEQLIVLYEKRFIWDIFMSPCFSDTSNVCIYWLKLHFKCIHNDLELKTSTFWVSWGHFFFFFQTLHSRERFLSIFSSAAFDCEYFPPSASLPDVVPLTRLLALSQSTEVCLRYAVPVEVRDICKPGENAKRLYNPFLSEPCVIS